MNAWRDYFQMGESTGWLTVEMFCSCIVHNPVLCACYLHTYMEEDAKHVSLLQENVHGIPGMLGSLDCMHVHWKNCPIAYQGAYQGKEKFSTLVLEAIVDHNLWFWHAASGFTGSCNDINILDVSPLHQQFLDGSHSKLISNLLLMNEKKRKLLLDGRKLHRRMWNVHLGYCKASHGYWQVLWRCGMRYIYSGHVYFMHYPA